MEVGCLKRRPNRSKGVVALGRVVAALVSLRNEVRRMLLVVLVVTEVIDKVVVAEDFEDVEQGEAVQEVRREVVVDAEEVLIAVWMVMLKAMEVAVWTIDLADLSMRCVYRRASIRKDCSDKRDKSVYGLTKRTV